MSVTDTHDHTDLVDRLAAYREPLDDAIVADLVARGSGRSGELRPGRRRAALMLAAATVIALAGVVGVVAVGPGRSPSTATEPPATLPPPSSSPVSLVEPLALGSAGEQVSALQRRLAELGFVAVPDGGEFGELTRSAVWAFEKVVLGRSGAEVTGVVDEAVWQALLGDVVIEARASTAAVRHVEVWLPEQVVVVVGRRGVELVTHASTGSGDEWCADVTIDPGEQGNEQGEAPVTRRRCGIATTPGGSYSVHRSREASARTALGRLVDPLYFNVGLAIAGSDDVPLEPVSRGEVRVPAAVIGHVRDLVGLGTPVLVFDGENDPFELGQQLPVFDWAGDETTDLPPGFGGGNGVVALGDSVMLGAAERLTEYGIVIDAEVSRQLVDVVPTASWLASIEPAAVVVHVGTNGTFQPETLDAVLDQLANVPYVVLLTVRADRSWTHRNNELIRASAADRVNVLVIDWAVRADECPGDCFATDGIHLRADGIRFYAQLIADRLGLTPS